MWTISTIGYSQASSRRAWASGVAAAQAAQAAASWAKPGAKLSAAP
jgi:hypothetical protein